MREPQDWPLFTMDKRTYSFLDCSCEDECLHNNCFYCQWMKEDCPANAEAN